MNWGVFGLPLNSHTWPGETWVPPKQNPEQGSKCRVFIFRPFQKVLVMGRDGDERHKRRQLAEGLLSPLPPWTSDSAGGQWSGCTSGLSRPGVELRHSFTESPGHDSELPPGGWTSPVLPAKWALGATESPGTEALRTLITSAMEPDPAADGPAPARQWSAGSCG